MVAIMVHTRARKGRARLDLGCLTVGAVFAAKALGHCLKPSQEAGGDAEHQHQQHHKGDLLKGRRLHPGPHLIAHLDYRHFAATELVARTRAPFRVQFPSRH